MDPRDAEEADIDPLAKLWYEGWLDAHAGIVPAEALSAGLYILRT